MTGPDALKEATSTGRHRAEPGRPSFVRANRDRHTPGHAKREWCCPRCLFVTDTVDAGMAHIRDHQAGAVPAMTDAEITAAIEAAYEPPAAWGPRLPDPIPAPIPPNPGQPQPDTNGDQS